jgi:aryl-alcohol dehydrogenase-like predicted oxidoreductase
MRPRPVPRATLAPGYDISRVIKGGWQLAGGHGPVDPAAALADMEAYVDAGVTTFDCADIYTGVEALIGRFLARRRVVRGGAGDVQVHTKYVPDRSSLPVLTRADVTAGIEQSLARLGVDALDLVQFHWWDYDTPGYVETAVWLNELRRAGRIRHLGLTNFDVPRMRDILDAGVVVVAHQVQGSLLDRRAFGAMRDLCQERGIALLCYGALAGGFLSERWLGRPEPAEPLENRSLVKYRLIIDEWGGWDRFQALLAGLDRVAHRHGVGIGAVAIRAVLDEPQVAGVITGARSAAHLDHVPSAVELRLDEADRGAWAALQQGAPGPAGDVYALERVKGGRHGAIMRYDLRGDG